MPIEIAERTDRHRKGVSINRVVFAPRRINPHPEEPMHANQVEELVELVRSSHMDTFTGNLRPGTVTLTVADRDALLDVLAARERELAEAKAERDVSKLLLQELILDPTLPEHLRANAHKVLGSVLAVAKERDTANRELDGLRAAVGQDKIDELWHDMWETADPESLGNYEWKFTNVKLAKMIDLWRAYFAAVAVFDGAGAGRAADRATLASCPTSAVGEAVRRLAIHIDDPDCDIGEHSTVCPYGCGRFNLHVDTRVVVEWANDQELLSPSPSETGRG